MAKHPAQQNVSVPVRVEVTEIRGHLADGEIEHFQVTLKIGFRMEDPKDA